jgi:exoribonuclease-2
MEDLQHKQILQRIAHRAMEERGLLPDFSAAELAELSRLQALPLEDHLQVRDLRSLLWCSIDNDDSLDLDQLSVAQQMPDQSIKILVAIADVDGLVKKGSLLDEHACHNTSSVYTTAQIFPMLPETLSTDLTSLKGGADRPAIIIEYTVNDNSEVQSSDVYLALVHNYAKLAYNSVAAWLEENGPMPEALAAVNGLPENLRLQDRAAQILKGFRQVHGALSLETREAHPVFTDSTLSSLEIEEKNRAKELIEDLMITANGVTARFLDAKKFPSLRRVVHEPKRWDRIVEVAAEHGAALPDQPDSKALEDFLVQAQKGDPLRFPDLSLTIIKLLGPGEYMADVPGQEAPGHFGLAVRDYSHSTAPNRRFPDLITHRLIKAALNGDPWPYSIDELTSLALHCTQEENEVNKVERQVNKSAAAILLEDRIGETFEAIVTGAADKGTWVRLLQFPVEGKLIQNFQGVDVGQKVKVKLVDVNVEKGFIDFKKIN